MAFKQGSATISVSSQGRTASLPITVWQDYQGTWIGEYRIRVCTATGDFKAAEFCSADLFGVGKLLPVRIIFTQTDGPASRHFVGSGTATLVRRGGSVDLLDWNV